MGVRGWFFSSIHCPSLMNKVREWIEERENRFRDRRIGKRLSLSPAIAEAVTFLDKPGQIRWGGFLTRIAGLPGVESSSGNTVEILSDSESSLSAMEAAVDAASTRVWLETYIFDSSEDVAGRMVEALIRAAKRGCDVVLVVDYIGSSGLVRWKKILEKNGVQVVLFNPFPWSHWLDGTVPKSVGPIPFRNHRKTLVADEIGFCGSMNIQGGFFDLNVRITGPAVAHLANVFRDSLAESGVGVERPPMTEPAPTGSSYVQVLQSNVRRERSAIQKALAKQIRTATTEVRVASSYFMPPGFLKRALLKAANDEKTDLKILVSGTTDFFPVPGDLLAQTHALRRFVGRNTTDVYLYSAAHMHAKFTVVDNVFACVGSYNFDWFSSRRNLEAAVGVFDKNVAQDLTNLHEKLCQNSVKATQQDGMYFQNPIARSVCWLAYLVMKYSGRNWFDGFDAYSQVNVGEARAVPFYFGRPDILAACHRF